MGESSIAQQADRYAEVIVGQIESNFKSLHEIIEADGKLEEFREAFRKELPSNTNGKDFVEKVIDKVFSKSPDVTKLMTASMNLEEAEQKRKKYASYEPLAVGLFGEWGSGKTHQLKLIESRLKKEPLQENGWYTIPVFFNAWRFEKEEHIILPLFQTLLATVESIERDHATSENLQRSWRALKVQLKAIKASMLDGFGMPESIPNTLLDLAQHDFANAAKSIYDVKKVLKRSKAITSRKLMGDQSLTQLLQPDQLESIYLNIPQWIEKITLFEQVNFVFLIDDLDRCLPENTLKMLESIKLFLDVPSCAFVLAVDDDVVERGVVHHYRDYLSIYHNADTQNAQNAMQHELPITGHEYLEKMIQLPIRLPVIDTVNVREFLQEYSAVWIDIVDKEYWEEIDEWKDGYEAIKNSGHKRREELYYSLKPKRLSVSILDFLSTAIPPKPRKIKRTAKLFESKIQLLHSMSLEDKCSYELLAKMTLLELFAPKILRFLQNNDYAETYRALYDFHYVNDDGESEEKIKNTLYDTEDILSFIKNNKDYTQEKKDRYEKLITMIGEHHNSRMAFDLSVVFSKREEYESLKVAIEYRESEAIDTRQKDDSRVSLLSKMMVNQLFVEDNPETWGATLREHNEILSLNQVNKLIAKAKKEKDSKFNNLPFIANPEWVGQMANFADEESYITLLKASHDARLKKIEGTEDMDSFEIDSFQMTFAEYDKYCELEGIEKPKDEGWGRGRRPVINVSWFEADKYTRWLNMNLNVDKKYRLPKKEEWELACSNGKKAIDKKLLWHFGDDKSKLGDYAWYSNNSENQAHKVGELKPNELGLYDMHGNVWEHCSNFDTANIGIKTKISKGGSWLNNLSATQISFINADIPNVQEDCVGFRLLRT